MATAAGEMHLLDVCVLPCAYVKEVIEGSWKNLQEGADKGSGRTLYGFKVVGENRLIALLDGGIESALQALNTAYGDQTKVTCIPLRSFETFAKEVLGADEELARTPFKRIAGNDDERFYWLVFTISYRGRTVVDLLKLWLREATSVFTMRNKDDIQVDMFKVLGERQVHSFWKMPDADILDNIVFTLPLMKELGDQVQITSKTIVCL